MREIYDVNSKSHWLQFVEFLKILVTFTILRISPMQAVNA